MDNIPETFGKYFNRLYKKDGYLDKYGGSVVATGFTLLIFFLIFSYFYVEPKIAPIRLCLGQDILMHPKVNQK